MGWFLVGTIMDPNPDPDPFLNNNSDFGSNSDSEPIFLVLNSVLIGKLGSGS